MLELKAVKVGYVALLLFFKIPVLTLRDSRSVMNSQHGQGDINSSPFCLEAIDLCS